MCTALLEVFSLTDIRRAPFVPDCVTVCYCVCTGTEDTAGDV